MIKNNQKLEIESDFEDDENSQGKIFFALLLDGYCLDRSFKSKGIFVGYDDGIKIEELDKKEDIKLVCPTEEDEIFNYVMQNF